MQHILTRRCYDYGSIAHIVNNHGFYAIQVIVCYTPHLGTILRGMVVLFLLQEGKAVSFPLRLELFEFCFGLEARLLLPYHFWEGGEVSRGVEAVEVVADHREGLLLQAVEHVLSGRGKQLGKHSTGDGDGDDRYE